MNPAPNTSSVSANRNAASDAISGCPAAIRISRSTAASRWPRTRSPSHAPSSWVKYEIDGASVEFEELRHERQRRHRPEYPFEHARNRMTGFGCPPDVKSVRLWGTYRATARQDVRARTTHEGHCFALRTPQRANARASIVRQSSSTSHDHKATPAASMARSCLGCQARGADTVDPLMVARKYRTRRTRLRT